jgi:hypothetical protein
VGGNRKNPHQGDAEARRREKHFVHRGRSIIPVRHPGQSQPEGRNGLSNTRKPSATGEEKVDGGDDG